MNFGEDRGKEGIRKYVMFFVLELAGKVTNGFKVLSMS